jgi:hypothetical protein
VTGASSSNGRERMGLGHRTSLGLNGPVSYTSKPGGRWTLHIPCVVDHKKHDFTTPKRFPTEVMLKKLQQAGWDVSAGKTRCPHCVHMGLKRDLVIEPEQPESIEDEIVIGPKDVKWETTRSRGPGGQHVNTTNSKVRVTHIDTGLTATSERFRSQHKNKDDALRKLTVRVRAHHQRQKEEAEVPKTTDNSVRLGISKSSIVLSVPKGNPLFAKFADDNGKPKARWTMELRSNPAPTGDPFLAVVKKDIPPGKERMKGAVGGTFNRQTGSFMLTMQPHLIPLVAKQGPFRSAPIEPRETHGDLMVFEFPKERKPVILRGDARLEAMTAPEPVIEEEAPIQELPADLPVLKQPEQAPGSKPADTVSEARRSRANAHSSRCRAGGQFP